MNRRSGKCLDLADVGAATYDSAAMSQRDQFEAAISFDAGLGRASCSIDPGALNERASSNPSCLEVFSDAEGSTQTIRLPSRDPTVDGECSPSVLHGARAQPFPDHFCFLF